MRMLSVMSLRDGGSLSVGTGGVDGGSLSSIQPSSASTSTPERRVRFACGDVTSVHTFDPFAGYNVSEEHMEAALKPGAVLVVPAAAYPQGVEIVDGQYVQYHFDLIIEGKRVHTISGRYSQLRKQACQAAHHCRLLPGFPPRRWWRDAFCAEHITQRSGELRLWLQQVVRGQGREPHPAMAGCALVDKQRHTAACKMLGLKKRSLVARLLCEAASTRKLTQKLGNGRLIERHPASICGGCETVDDAQSHSEESASEGEMVSSVGSPDTCVLW
eukprot:Hpha_TRINITY_DN16422_c1_g1::TRINITY_DN16422_c1_g1_i1::g.163606::m.163606/K17928/SNX16; sorting nexin-16